MKGFSKIITLVFFAFLFLVASQFVIDDAFASSNGSTIGSVSVEDLSDQEIQKQITTAVADWKNNEICITIGDRKVLLNGGDFQFDIVASIKRYENDTAIPWYEFWKKNPTVHEPLMVEVNPSIKEKVERQTGLKWGEIQSQLLEAASNLKESPIKIHTTDFSIKSAERISFQTIQIPDSQVLDVTAIVKKLDGVMIEPETPFSFNDLATKVSSSDDTMSLVASALYSAVLQSSFEITERHQADDIPTYVQPGYEASVSPFLEKDLQFVSHQTVPAKISASVKSNVLKIELYSLPGNPEVTVLEKNRITVEPRTIYRYSDNVAKGTSKMIQQSQSGLQLSIYRTITDENGGSKTQMISENYYAPRNEIIEKSSSETSTTKENGNSDGSNNSTKNNVNNKNSTSNSNSTNNSEQSSNLSSTNHYKKATKSKNGGSLPKGSYYNQTGEIVTPNDTK